MANHNHGGLSQPELCVFFVKSQISEEGMKALNTLKSEGLVCSIGDIEPIAADGISVVFRDGYVQGNMELSDVSICDNCGKEKGDLKMQITKREEEWCASCIENDGDYEEEEN